MVYDKGEGSAGKKKRRGKYSGAQPASDQQIQAAINSLMGYQMGMPGNSFNDVSMPVAPHTTIQGKRTNFKNKSGGPEFKSEPPTTIRGKKQVPKGANAGYDPYADLPTMQDVQSQSLGILDELVQGMLFDQGGSSYDYESAMQNVAQGIRKAYAADIAAIRGNIKDARKDTKRARKETERMYRGLARSYGQDARQAETAGDNAVAEIQNIANQATQNVQNSNTQLLNERATLLKNLGIEEAAPAAMDETPAAGMDAIQTIQQQSNVAGIQQSQMADANKQYFRAGRAGARMEGTDRSLDLLEQFLDYKRGNKDQIRSLKGQRAREIAQSNASIQGQAAEAAAQADAETWSRLMEYMGMRSDLEQQNIENMMGANQFQWDQYMDVEGLKQDRRELNRNLKNDKRDWLLDKYKAQNSGSSSQDNLYDLLPREIGNPAQIISQSLPPQQAARVSSIIEGLRRTPAFRYGTVRNPGDGQNYKLSPEQAAQMAEQAGKQAGLSREEINILRLAAMASV